MFKLIAILFIVTNGAPDRPLGAMGEADHTFPTEEACKTFVASKEGKASKQRLDKFVAKAAAPAKIKSELACIKAEDNSI